ncbi:carboxypeptidase-like regulatory domain-containing protein [Maioricimonas sp. JC845]|uniref:carboxypeptidase-like regulatory domain-containing protein n=1 Tax=Maioricimonas sp. JC845 TaxID=3232138 RepID=UPI00345A0D7D
MRWQQRLPQIAFALACLGMLIPHTPASAGSMMARPAVDVALTRNGTLQGQLVDSQGRPLAGRTVAVRQSGRDVARTMTASDGVYRLAPLSPGVYEVVAEGQSRSLRIWTHHAAPPTARPLAILVTGNDPIRAQGYEEPFPPWLVTLGGTAALAGIGIGLAGSHDLETKVKTTTSP